MPDPRQNTPPALPSASLRQFRTLHPAADKPDLSADELVDLATDYIDKALDRAQERSKRP